MVSGCRLARSACSKVVRCENGRQGEDVGIVGDGRVALVVAGLHAHEGRKKEERSTWLLMST